MPVPRCLGISLAWPKPGSLTNIISVCSYICTVGVISNTMSFLTLSGLSSASRCATLDPRSCETMKKESKPKCFLPISDSQLPNEALT